MSVEVIGGSEVWVAGRGSVTLGSSSLLRNAENGDIFGILEVGEAVEDSATHGVDQSYNNT